MGKKTQEIGRNLNNMHLTESEKLEISAMYRSGNFYLREIAEWIGCSYFSVDKYKDYKGEQRNEKN